MSCTYADGLSPYENKGILGVSEIFNSKEDVKGKCSTLAKLIKEAKHVVVHTGAGISTSAGIPDFRGPNGVWTLEEKGLKPTINISFSDAQPTKTHMALKQLMDKGMVHYIVSQNIDGLHLKSGIKREMLAELHGNMFIDQCNFCKRQFVRSSPAPTVGQRTTGVQCHGGGTARKPCRGKLHDTILDWEHSLPDDDLDLSDKHSCIADLSICLGTTLQINPSGSVPLNTLRYGGKLVICNLQPTKHDNKADLIINTYVDDIFEEVMKLLNISIPEYKPDEDPVFISKNEYIEWTIPKALLGQLKKKFKKNCDGGVKKRVLVKKEYKEQQEELRNRTKALKKLQKLKTKRSNLMKRPRINDLLNDDVIELSTSDEDDVNIVNDSRNDVDMESITKDTKEAETDGLIAKCKEDAKTSLKEETVKIFQSSIEEEYKLDSNKVKSLLDEVLIKPDNSLELLAKDEPVVKDESEVILNAFTEDKTESCKATIKEVEPKNNSESKEESQDNAREQSNENMDSSLGVTNGKINTFKNEMECEGIKTNNLSSEKHEFSAKADDIISSL